MSFPRYPHYKDSGVEWLGEVPEHWEVKRLRFVASLNPSKAESEQLDRVTTVSFLPMESIGEDGKVRLEQEKAISEVQSGYTYFRDGDVVIAKITPCFENGKGALVTGLTNGVGFGTTELIVARPRSGQVNGRYLHLLFQSREFRSLGEAQMYGAGGQKRVPDAFVRDFATAFPPITDQLAIVEFVRRETAKIDALLSEQQHLIELLKEKRQAVISHAVTRGLDPDAPMKPSGLEWPATVPIHWEVTRLGREITLQRGVDITKDQQYPGNVPVVSSGGITSWHNEAFAVGPGVLVGRKGSAGTLHYVESDYWPHDTTLYVEDFGNNLPRFVYYKLQSMDLVSYDTGSSNPTINRNLVHPVHVSWPPVSEQRQIVAFIDAIAAMVDGLTKMAERATTLLRERRTALISAAVTGKIDVRNLTEAA